MCVKQLERRHVHLHSLGGARVPRWTACCMPHARESSLFALGVQAEGCIGGQLCKPIVPCLICVAFKMANFGYSVRLFFVLCVINTIIK